MTFCPIEPRSPLSPRTRVYMTFYTIQSVCFINSIIAFVTSSFLFTDISCVLYNFSAVNEGFEMPPMENLSKFVAELIGTALLMFGGCMGCLTWGKEANSFFNALSFGMVVMTLVQAYGAVSGAHFNPAVTIAALVFKVISLPVSA